MPELQIYNPQALYGLQWAPNSQRVVHYVNCSNRTMYTGDLVVLAQQANAVLGSFAGPGTPAVVALNNVSGTSTVILVPGCSHSVSSSNAMVLGVVGTRDASTIDIIPGGSIGTIGGSTVNTAGTISPNTTTTGCPEFTAYPIGSVVPVIVEGPARITSAGVTGAGAIAAAGLITTLVGATYGNVGGQSVTTAGTLGNTVGVGLEASTYSAANLQTGAADNNITGIQVVAGTTAQSATTVVTQTDPRSAANDIPSGLPTTGSFPVTGVIQTNQSGTIIYISYTGIGSTGFTVSATAVSAAGGIVSGTIIRLVSQTVRCIVKLA